MAPFIVLVLALVSAPQIALPVFLLGWVLIILGALFGTLAVISLVHSTPKETDREAYLRDFTDRQERRDQW